MPNCEGTAGCSKRSVPRSAPCSPCRPSRSPSCRKGRETDPADGRQPTEDRRRARRGCRGQGTPDCRATDFACDRCRHQPCGSRLLGERAFVTGSAGLPRGRLMKRRLREACHKVNESKARTLAENPPHPKGKRGRTGNSPPPAGASGHHVFRRDGAGTSDPEFEGPVSMIEAAPCERDALEGLSGPATRQGTCAGNCSCVRPRRHSRLQEQAPGCKAR